MEYDVLIVGCGPVGCVLAERFAKIANKKVLVIDKRSHIAGNCYDEKHESGVLIHKYGPHYFRTNDENLVKYLSDFTEWIEGNYYVTSEFKEESYPFPINKLTINKFFKKEFKEESEAKEFIENLRLKIDNPKNSEEFVLSRVGKELYEAFYLGYTLKQWNLHPKDLGPSVCGRIPVRYNEDCRYVDHQFQLTPKHGFTNLFNNMLNHENIDKKLETDFRELTNIKFKTIIYTGAIDEYFNYKYGKLKWRSLNFIFKTYNQEFKQPNVQINYSNNFEYTRTVEIKHITKQKIDKTVVSYEYPTDEGDPYYPIPNTLNEKMYQKYKLLAELETIKNNVHFCGRLAEYKYYNTDEVILKALELFEKIQKNDK